MVKWTYEIPITQRNGTTHFLATSKEHSHLLEEYVWHANKGKKTFYAATHIVRDGKETTLLIHRLIMGLEFGDTREVDHRDGNGMNNTMENLRICSHGENGKNLGVSKANTSGVPGVSWDKKAKKWHAFIKVDGKQIHLGYYTNKADAIAARKAAELKYFGEFARQ